MVSSLAWHRVTKCWPCKRSSFSEPNNVSLQALTLLCQAEDAESFRSAWTCPVSTDSHAIGRSRGGLSTKTLVTIDAQGFPTGIVLTPGQAHDLQGANVLLKDTPVPTIIADRACNAL